MPQDDIDEVEVVSITCVSYKTGKIIQKRPHPRMKELESYLKKIDSIFTNLYFDEDLPEEKMENAINNLVDDVKRVVEKHLDKINSD